MRTSCFLALVGCVQGFVNPLSAFHGAAVARAASRTAAAANGVQMFSPALFEGAQAEFASDFPLFAKYGWGPSTKAERWNGRHAMAGWVVIVATGYAKAHGLIPNPDMLLDVKQWGTLATISGATAISNERAIIMVAHMHLLMMSICSAIAPLSFQDTLLLKEGEKDEPAPGLIPAFVPGLTKEAEMSNGRMAMLGLILVAGHSLATGTSFLDSVNLFLGGLLF